MTRPPQHEFSDAADGWSGLTWDDLEAWAGSRTVTRGQSYQRQNRVHDLAISREDQLFATVTGSRNYTTAVWWLTGIEARQHSVGGPLQSRCSCPVGYDGCKHAVAVVAEYLQRLADNADVDKADDAAARWAILDGETDQPPCERPSDDQIRRYIEGNSREDLIVLLESLTQRYPELREELAEQLMLKEGDTDYLRRQVRRELETVTAEPGWHDHWADEDCIPDYSRLTRRLEKLVELGDYSAVMDLGPEILDRGMAQVEQSDDEGETAMALGECLPVVFEAVARIDLPPAEKLLFAIDAHLKDDFDIVGDATKSLFDAEHAISDWSRVADTLAQRLASMGRNAADNFPRPYQRDHLSDWLARALDAADRAGEIGALYEREARLTNSYQRLVRFLIDQQQYDDAEAWATEGIEATRDRWRGIAAGLVNMLKELAELRGRNDVVASHAAQQFFEKPSLRTFQELDATLGKLADKTVQQQVRQAALHFLETGEAPVRIKASKQQGRHSAVDSAWPLPVPENLVVSADLTRPERQQPHYSVLLEIALMKGQIDDILHWYDRLSAGYTVSPMGNRHPGRNYADRVAQAVAATNPQKALALYDQGLEANLSEASPAAYEACATYLRQMKPIMQSLDQATEWQQLVADIREQYRRRPRFMEVLDRLEGATIIQTRRNRGTTR